MSPSSKGQAVRAYPDTIQITLIFELRVFLKINLAFPQIFFLEGIESRLPYLNEIGVETIWISPVYKSPMVDFGYDISDFVDIDPIFGTLEDFKTLVDSAHEFGIKIVMDYVPNHSR